ncbi:flagellar hook-basal body complex protein FliE [Jiella sp. MQZ9-1]|uniref:Flagellar hook-basal body complex protein FliE n=1 Tax=Jiella flava TaxID=2816857 RepID=A0A939JSC7_9HYPH|nr:flagellar hook-basal body complex protein FliE [Jiella flava]MBO0660950.1 flagellar hook-basal body complex protein FliE [Jiella flava]MCD2469598.1 flagellar hook-basal body complex protein FliE [Jiella flava]
MIPAIGSSLPTVGLAPTSAIATGATGGSSDIAGGQSFGAMLTKLASDAVSTVKTAEATSIKGVNGQASTQAVVEAVMDAERTLQTAIAIRDKAVSAYLELSRMAI